MLHSLDSQLSAIDWIRSPLDVPIPTQSEASPELPLGAFGRTRVAVASRIQDPLPTGPVLKAGPIAASTEVNATAAAAARVERTWREGDIVMLVMVVVAVDAEMLETVLL